MNYWLVKTEPNNYSWEDFVQKGGDMWEGVRNYQARNNLLAMRLNDLVLFYHSNKGKEIVGLAKVTKEAYQDPTTEDNRWVVVELIPQKKFDKTITLKEIKADVRLKDSALIKQSRLSVIPIKTDEYEIILSKVYF